MATAEYAPAVLRTRPVATGHWRAFLAVARHLNFRAAADELALTQSAVSRQIQALEEEVGVALFLRHTRAVELTSAGAQLQRAVAPALERMDAAVRQVRQTAGRRSVAITTWASFASMWLIPRMEEFQRDNPGIDIRIDASDVPVDLETSDVDLALRYTLPGPGTQGGLRLFGEQLAVVASPWLLKSGKPLRTPADVAQFTLIEAGDAHRSKGGVPDEIPEVALTGAPLGIGALLKQANLAPSTSEANRLIDGGGVRVDGGVVSDRGLKLDAGTYVVQVGKRKFARVNLA